MTRTHDQETIPSLVPRHGVLTLNGYGLRVAVNRGHLIVEDGIGSKRRRGRFSRVSRDLKRLIILGHSGSVSFDALRWLHDVGVSFAQIDADGRVIAATGPIGLNEPRLRRAQALASQNGAGLAIARDLLHEKLAGQASLLKLLGGSAEAVAGILSAQKALHVTRSSAHLRVLEATAASVYWDTWRDFPVRFARSDQRRVPAHWKTVGTRSSLLTGSPRKAINPANALLNYLYAVVEAEARLAALAVGCDPGLGLLHADLRSRDSLACDLMEPVRPTVDAFVFDTLSSRVFRREELFETRDGVCRLLSPLTQSLVETASRWAKAVAPIAERVARRLADSATETLSEGRSSKSIRLPTPLTEAKRRASQQEVSLRRVARALGRGNGLARTCQVCGAALATARQAFCDTCRPSAMEMTAKGREALRRRRAEGKDPAHGGSAAVARGSRISETQRAIAEWEAKNPIPRDSTVYYRDVLPRLQSVSVPAIVRATGLSYPYCAQIRRGLRVPHPMHWEKLGMLSENPENLG